MDCRITGSSIIKILQAKKKKKKIFFKQEYWNGLSCSPLGHLPDPEIEPMSPESPALQADYLSTEMLGSPMIEAIHC